MTFVPGQPISGGRSSFRERNRLVIHHHQPPHPQQQPYGRDDLGATSLPKPPPPPVASKPRLRQPTVLGMTKMLFQIKRLDQLSNCILFSAATTLPRNSAATLPRNFGQTMVIRRNRQGTTSTFRSTVGVGGPPAIQLPSPPCPPSSFALSALV